MSTFRFNSYKLALSPEEIKHWEDVAVSGTRICGYRGGYDCAPAVGDNRQVTEDLAVATIATMGNGNSGYDFVVGITPRGRELCRQGRMKVLTQAGISSEVAAVAARNRHGMELPVVKLAEELVGIAGRIDCPEGHRRFRSAIGIDIPEGMSFPRVQSAWNIASQVK